MFSIFHLFDITEGPGASRKDRIGMKYFHGHASSILIHHFYLSNTKVTRHALGLQGESPGETDSSSMYEDECKKELESVQ